LLGDVEKKAGRCQGLSEKQIESYLELMDFAARSGVVEAQLSYSDYAADSMVSPESIANPQRIIDYKRKSLKYYNLALGAGEVKALGLLSSAYENGILAEKDMYKAYVYAYAYALSKNGSSGANQWLAQMESALTVSQLQSARSEAQQIYTRCCR
jgi:TPR repeat protein